MSGRRSREKGRRGELAIARYLQAAGIAAEKCSRAGYTGPDLSVRLLDRDLRGECKVRATGFGQIYDFLSDCDLLFIRADRKPALVVLRLDLAAEIAKKKVTK